MVISKHYSGRFYTFRVYCTWICRIMIDQHFSVYSLPSKEFCLFANLFGLLNISIYYSPLSPAAEGTVFYSFPHTIWMISKRKFRLYTFQFKFRGLPAQNQAAVCSIDILYRDSSIGFYTGEGHEKGILLRSVYGSVHSSFAYSTDMMMTTFWPLNYAYGAQVEIPAGCRAMSFK